MEKTYFVCTIFCLFVASSLASSSGKNEESFSYSSKVENSGNRHSQKVSPRTFNILGGDDDGDGALSLALAALLLSGLALLAGLLGPLVTFAFGGMGLFNNNNNLNGLNNNGLGLGTNGIVNGGNVAVTAQGRRKRNAEASDMTKNFWDILSGIEKAYKKYEVGSK